MTSKNLTLKYILSFHPAFHSVNPISTCHYLLNTCKILAVRCLDRRVGKVSTFPNKLNRKEGKQLTVFISALNKSYFLG